MNSDRIKEIQVATAYPDSNSVQQALLQVWNECAQDADKRVAELAAELVQERLAESIMEIKYDDAKRERDQALKRVAELEEQIETRQGLRGVLQRAERAEHERDEAEKKITGLEAKVMESAREVRRATSRLSGMTQRAHRAESAETLVKMLQDRNSYMEQTSQANYACMKLQDEISKLELDLRQAKAELAVRSKQGAIECSQCGRPLPGPPKVCFNCTPTWGLEQLTRAERAERERDELRRMLQHYTDTVKVSLKHADVCITEPKAPPAVAVPEQDLVRLDFMVDPDALKLRAFVPDPVRVLVTDPASIFITGILGESGRRMVASGMVFIMTRSLAEKLISHHVAIESRP